MKPFSFSTDPSAVDRISNPPSRTGEASTSRSRRGRDGDTGQHVRVSTVCAWLAVFVAGAVGSPLAADAGFYLRGSLGADATEEGRFRDDDCSSTQPPALFGCVAGNDGEPLGATGDFGTVPAVEVGVGVRWSHRIRTELRLDVRPRLDFAGDANFLAVDGEQPVDADGSALALFAVVLVDLSDVGPLTPFLGAGLGASSLRTGEVTYRFPGLGDEAVTVIRGGDHTSMAHLLTAGLSWPLGERTVLELAYRYVDLGELRTDAGRATIVRSSGTFELDIAGTLLAVRAHGVELGLRYRF